MEAVYVIEFSDETVEEKSWDAVAYKTFEAAEAVLLSDGYLKENDSRDNVFFEKESEVQLRYADILQLKVVG